MNNFENSILEPVRFQNVLGEHAPKPLEVLAFEFGASKTCFVCHERLSGCGPVWQRF